MGVTLQVLAGPHRGRRFELTQHDTFLLGRSPECQCSLPDDRFVSRHHFLLEVNGAACALKDLQSRNGVVVNGRRLRWQATLHRGDSGSATSLVRYLKHGDELRVGRTVIRLEVTSAAVCRTCAGEVHPRDQMRGEWAPVGFRCFYCRESEARGGEHEPEGGSTDPSGPAVPGVRRSTITRTDEDHIFHGFDLVRPLGGHDTTRVFLVRERATGRELVLKALCPASHDNGEQARCRFVREMEICMALRHPGIVHFEGQGEAGPDFYFLMEHCPEGSVADRCDASGGRLDPREAVGFICEVLDALAFAHDKGVVHRDVKPSNVLLATEAGKLRARLSDFGLAKNFQLAGLSGITVSSYFSGSWPYVPPEQVVAFKRVQPSSDIFSAGATLYRMLTGEYVYDFRDGEDFIRAVLDRRTVPVRSRDETIPEPLARVVDRATETEPVRRFRSAREMRDALIESIGGPPSGSGAWLGKSS